MSSDMKTKTTSNWIQHVKDFAKANNIKYNEALRDPNLKVGYVKVERIKKPKMSSSMSPKSTIANKKHESTEMVMELNTNYDKLQTPMKMKKGRKNKDMMVVMEPPPMMIQTESGDLQQVPEIKKVRTKLAKKKEPVMM
jgi:hypothetical protein